MLRLRQNELYEVTTVLPNPFDRTMGALSAFDVPYDTELFLMPQGDKEVVCAKDTLGNIWANPQLFYAEAFTGSLRIELEDEKVRGLRFLSSSRCTTRTWWYENVTGNHQLLVSMQMHPDDANLLIERYTSYIAQFVRVPKNAGGERVKEYVTRAANDFIIPAPVVGDESDAESVIVVCTPQDEEFSTEVVSVRDMRARGRSFKRKRGMTKMSSLLKNVVTRIDGYLLTKPVQVGCSRCRYTNCSACLDKAFHTEGV